MPAIVVLVKSVPDTWSEKTLEADYTIDRVNADTVIDEINEYAVEQALRLREAHPESQYRVVALSAGPESAEAALRKAIAMGADDAVHVVDAALAGSDVLGTTWALTNAINTIEDVALVIAGDASSDGASGALPGIVAEYRQVPALTYLREVRLEGDAVVGVREDHRGTWELRAALPAVISVTDKADKPRFANFKGIMAAKKHQITTVDLAGIGVSPEQVGLAHSATVVTGAAQRPPRAAGRTVRGEEAAAEVAQFLADENLL
ncbi:electron transfer flavoprotein subunit beta/FixA family protein [Corynebacterium oculi]|uniref:Electron transfer flavoprotein subunit beta n=1 Tax=Corynebacterium oculi TaxID=1544416 RepID=A0A0Q1AAQ6_9CORY|nr:electron transfer flavoprotein subunit beta/FixA family protein [Corynebacterium oculi]KQB83805.1 Electron transfer flavoprotein subunit beta [Corynebacterium oculi]